MPLHFLNSVVVSLSGDRQDAYRAVCVCGSEKFRLFQIKTQTHFHIECGLCHESYCPGGNCAVAQEIPDEEK